MIHTFTIKARHHWKDLLKIKLLNAYIGFDKDRLSKFTENTDYSYIDLHIDWLELFWPHGDIPILLLTCMCRRKQSADSALSGPPAGLVEFHHPHYIHTHTITYHTHYTLSHITHCHTSPASHKAHLFLSLPADRMRPSSSVVNIANTGPLWAPDTTRTSPASCHTHTSPLTLPVNVTSSCM